MFKEKKIFTLGTDTLIGQGSEFDGKMKCATNLRIEGKLTGDIECTKDVIIGESGMVHSNIKASDLIIAGKVFGDITAKGKIEIMPNGQLNGNFSCASLIIHEGAIFNGTSKMENGAPERRQETKPQVVEKSKKSS